MATPILSMQASRCPDATIQMRQLVRMFVAQPDVGVLELESIEPSLIRSLPAFVEAESLDVQITQLASRTITAEDIALWSEHFDEDDYSDVAVVNRFVLTKPAAPQTKTT